MHLNSRTSRRAPYILTTAAAALALAVALTGCGSGDSGAADDTPTASVPTSTPQPVLQPFPTLGVDPLDYPLQRRESITGQYTIDVPEGWIPAENLNVGNEETFDLKDANGLLQAQVAITCEAVLPKNDGTVWGPRDYLERDMAYVRQTSGGEVGETVSVTSGDLNGIAVNYSTSFGGFGIRQQAVYFVNDDCAWILRLRLFAPGDPRDVVRLFARMIGTFRPV